ncbi:MAG: S41 family peptidase, partial [Planctomycetota bacterium]
MTRRQFLYLIVPLLAVLLGFVLLGLVDGRGAGGRLPWDESFAAEIRAAVAQEFVGGVPDRRKAWEACFRALDAYVKTYDPNAAVTPPWERDRQREDSRGLYGGIGVRTTAAPRSGPVESVEVTAVKPRGPADLAGIRVGERIVAVGGVPLPAICPDGDTGPLERTIRGVPDTLVRLTVRSKAGADRDVDVKRQEINTGSVFGARILDAERGIGYLRLSGFHEKAYEEFRTGLEGLGKRGMRAFVLDLRANRGGLLTQAVKIADALLGSGLIVRVRGRASYTTDTHVADAATLLADEVPVAVLLDRHTASASEVIAGALQD